MYSSSRSDTFTGYLRRRKAVWNDAKGVKKPVESSTGLVLLAEWTGLEPATPGVTGRYSNQLNYHS